MELLGVLKLLIRSELPTDKIQLWKFVLLWTFFYRQGQYSMIHSHEILSCGTIFCFKYEHTGMNMKKLCPSKLYLL